MTRKEFGIYAEMSYLYYCLGRLVKEIKKPLSPILRMIDMACGFKEKPGKSGVADVIKIIREIISRKNKLGIDVSEDEDCLDSLLKLKKEK